MTAPTQHTDSETVADLSNIVVALFEEKRRILNWDNSLNADYVEETALKILESFETAERYWCLISKREILENVTITYAEQQRSIYWAIRGNGRNDEEAVAIIKGVREQYLSQITKAVKRIRMERMLIGMRTDFSGHPRFIN